MKYSTFATCAALPIIAITASCTNSPENLMERMLTVTQMITTLVEETTEDNVEEQRVKLQKAFAELYELKQKIEKLSPKQKEAIEQNTVLKEKAETIITKNLQTLMESMFKKPELMQRLMEGIDLQHGMR